MRENAVREFFKRHVQNTPEREVVFDADITVGILSLPLEPIVKHCGEVYISTRTLKHLYDKRSAEEFDLLVNNVKAIVECPDACYRNKSGKRGSFCLVKNLNEAPHLVSIEIESRTDGTQFHVVTAFRARYPRYLRNYELLWDRRDGRARSS